MIDLWQSRRDFFLDCEWWSVDRNYSDSLLNKLTYENFPNGAFKAKEYNSYSQDNQELGGAFMFEQNTLTIVTRDNISELKLNDVVRIDEKNYRVDSIQKNPVKKQRQYLKNDYSMEYVISLRG